MRIQRRLRLHFPHSIYEENNVWIFHLESLTNYIFPGVHELSSHSCNTHEDCGNNQTFECDYLNPSLQRKVCKCKDGWLLNPKTQTCGKINISRKF